MFDLHLETGKAKRNASSYGKYELQPYSWLGDHVVGKSDFVGLMYPSEFSYPYQVGEVSQQHSFPEGWRLYWILFLCKLLQHSIQMYLTF
jgi:hypothetical protein